MHASEAGATNHARILSANLLMQKVVPGAVFAICVRVFTSPMHQKATNAGYKLTTDDTSLKKICDQRVVQAECHIVHGIDVLEKLPDSKPVFRIIILLSGFNAYKTHMILKTCPSGELHVASCTCWDTCDTVCNIVWAHLSWSAFMCRGPVPTKKCHICKGLLTDLALELMKVSLRDLCSIST